MLSDVMVASLLHAALRRDTAAASRGPPPPPMPPTRARRLYRGGGAGGAFGDDVEGSSGGGGGGGEDGGGRHRRWWHLTTCVSNLDERVRTAILWIALLATTLAVVVATGRVAHSYMTRRIGLHSPLGCVRFGYMEHTGYHQLDVFFDDCAK
jgi:hypothetical protein